MSEASVNTGSTAGPTTAGRMIREARQAQGLHIAALAASIKVSQRKLELLEADRLDELPDATFARALAQTVCRSLKVDPAPVLALLPQLAGHRLEHVSVGINAPFRDRPGRHEPRDWSDLASPAVWAPLLVLLAAAAVYFLPAGWFSKLPSLSSFGLSASGVFDRARAAGPSDAGSAASPASGAETGLALSPETAASAVVETVYSAQPPDGAASAVQDSALKPAGPLQLRATSESWIEVLDARSQVLLSRMLQPGETVVLDGNMPFKLKIGNAAGTEVSFRGQPLELASHTRDNVARLELK